MPHEQQLAVVSGDYFPNIERVLLNFLLAAPTVDVGEWQAKQGGVTAQTLEREDVTIEWPIPADLVELREQVRPNNPWADEHFAERVSGVPHNPPPSAERWPFKQKNHAEHLNANGRFSHTYPERFWPRYAGVAGSIDSGGWRGIRFRYGDLNDLVQLLRVRPRTRQAYLPVWFPEDTGAHHDQRVPCTLGYHFMRRDDQLKCVYYIRSCDFLRHFRDDVYLAARLTHWLCDRLNGMDQPRIVPGRLVMHISSLHVFEADRQILAFKQRRAAR